MQKLEIRARGVEPSRVARHEQHAGAVLGRVSFVLEMHAPARGALHDVDDVVVLARVDRELPALQDRSPVHRQVLRAAQALVANRPFQPGFDALGFGGVRVDD